MSLNKKIIFLVILIVATVFGISTISFYYAYTWLNDAINSTESSFLKRSAVMSDLFFDRFRVAARDVGIFYATTNETGESQFVECLARFLEENRPYGITDIFLVSAKTGNVLGSNGWRDEKTDYRHDPWYRESMASNQVVLGKPYQDPTTGHGVFNVMYKVEDNNKNPLGLLNIVVNVNKVRESLSFQSLSDVEEGYPLFDVIPEEFIAGYVFPKEPLDGQRTHFVLFSAALTVGTIGLILFVLVPVSSNLRHTVRKIEHTSRVIKATFAPSEEDSTPGTIEEFFQQERVDRIAVSLQSIMDEIQDQMQYTRFQEFREILEGIHSTMMVVAEQQADLTAHAQEIMATNSSMSYINAQLLRRELVWSSLLEITQSITSNLDFHVALERVADAIKNVTQAYGVGVLAVQGDKLVPLIFSGYQDTERALEKYRTSLNSTFLTRRALETHSVQWVEDVHSSKEYWEIDKNVCSQVEFPLYQGEQAVGGMILSFDKRYHPNEEFLTTMAPVGASLSGYLNTWKAHQEIRSSYEYLMLKFQEIADIYHHETASHLVRVGRYSAMAAAWLSCTPQEQQDILIFSRVHDLGKIRVPVEIVIKPSGLTQEEFEIMKQHTVWGADLIGSAEWLKMARNICLNHHERWDGTGYPYGLKGDAISMEGRIVSLVDVYDALRSPRSYKGGYDHEKTVDIIVNGDGRTLPQHFDPDLLEFFKRNHEEMDKIFSETEGV